MYNSAHGWGACVNSLIVERIVGLRSIPGGRKDFVPRPDLAPDLSYRNVTQRRRESVVFRNGVVERTGDTYDGTLESS